MPAISRIEYIAESMTLREEILEVGKIKVTVADLWTVVPPSRLCVNQVKDIRQEVPRFQPGWLTDTVSGWFLFYF